MKIELRKVVFSKALSEETNAYTADLYVDGALIAHLANRGQGGSDEQHPAKGKTYADIQRVEEWIKANVPARETEFMIEGKPFIMEPDLESVCGDLLAEHLSTKELTRLLKRTIVYIVQKDVFTFKGKIEEARRPDLIARTRAAKPDAVILNALPFDEALKAYRSAAQ